MIDPATPVWQLTVGEFVSLMENSSPTVQEDEKPKEEVFFTTMEACRYLNISKSTIMRWKDAEYIKAEKLGGLLRFRKSELDRVLNK